VDQVTRPRRGRLRARLAGASRTGQLYAPSHPLAARVHSLNEALQQMLTDQRPSRSASSARRSSSATSVAARCQSMGEMIRRLKSLGTAHAFDRGVTLVR
jgi:hypothetical protein